MDCRPVGRLAVELGGKGGRSGGDSGEFNSTGTVRAFCPVRALAVWQQDCDGRSDISTTRASARGSSRPLRARRKRQAPRRARLGRSAAPDGGAAARSSGPSGGHQLTQHERQDSAVTEIVDLDRGVDAQQHGDPLRRSLDHPLNCSGSTPMPTRLERWMRSKLLRHDGLHAEQLRALGGPVARRAGAVFLAGRRSPRHRRPVGFMAAS
jgi:hypothetical protein